MMDSKVIFIIIIGVVVLGLFFLLSKNNKTDGKKKKSTQKLQNASQNLTPKQLERIIKEEEDILGYKHEDEGQIMEKIKEDRSLDNLAQYADKITRQYISDEKFLKAQVPDDLLNRLKSVPIDKDTMAYDNLINPTTIGNSAFIILNTEEPYKTRAQQALDYILEKLK